MKRTMYGLFALATLIGLIPWVLGSVGMSGGSGSVPTGAIVLVDTGSCPANFAEVTALQGRYPRGILAAGETMGTAVGTVLTVNENRTVQAHQHTYDKATTIINLDAPGATPFFTSNASVLTTSTGSGSGTQAPYVIMRFCKKG